MKQRAKRRQKAEARAIWNLQVKLSQEVQDAIIQSTIKDALGQQKRNNEELDAQRKAKEENEELIRELNLHSATEAYIDAMVEPRDVPGESALGSATYQNCWNLTVLTSLNNLFLLHDINSAPLDWMTHFTDGTRRLRTPIHDQQEALNGAPATCESAIGELTYQLQQFGRIRN